MSHKSSLFVLWGERPESITRYEFDTESERGAFMLGVEQAQGWGNWTATFTAAEAEQILKDSME
jgi:hypothetical protein